MLIDTHFKQIGLAPERYVSNIFSMCFQNKAKDIGTHFMYDLNTTADRYLEHQIIFNLILDNSFLTEKLYESFINDFWFESVKQAGIDVRSYKSSIGHFFEDYAVHILKQSFNFLKHPSPKALHELLASPNGTQVELADIYIRQNKKVLIGQIKSTGIYSDQQYDTAQSLFKNKEDYFYDVFGLKSNCGQPSISKRLSKTIRRGISCRETSRGISCNNCE